MRRTALCCLLTLVWGCYSDEKGVLEPTPTPVATAADSVAIPGDAWTGEKCVSDRECEQEVGAGVCERAFCLEGECFVEAEAPGARCKLPGEGAAACVVGACVPGVTGATCEPAPAPDGYPCGAFYAACGAAGKCTAGSCTDPCETVACNSGTCTPQGCVYTPVNGAECSDGNPCTTQDICLDGNCVGTSVCECTSDSDCTQLEDEDLCNGSLYCKNSQCVLRPGSVVECSATGAEPCQTSQCDPETGLCAVVVASDGTACDDGNECTETDRCLAGDCSDSLTTVCEYVCGDQLDDDADGHVDCWDPDCVQSPYCPVACGDGICQPWEQCGNCAVDCPCGCNETCDGNVCTFHGCDGKECGDNGCGGVCGTCDGAQESCEQGLCVCEPVCDGMECGDDGCGGLCGVCPGPSDVCLAGSCQCIPACEGVRCGDDGCGGLCPTCPTGSECVSGVCEAACGDGLCLSFESCAACPEDCGACPPDFVEIPAGTAWIGSPDGCPEPDEYPGACEAEPGRKTDEVLHLVTITRPFEMQTGEVTQYQWQQAFPGWNPSYFNDCGPNCPVERVSWYDSLVYLNWMSTQAGLEPCYILGGVMCTDYTDAGSNIAACMNATKGGIRYAYVGLAGGAATPYQCEGYRLPTEGEWEYAARAGTQTATYKGDMVVVSTFNAPVLDDHIWYAGNSGVTYSTGMDCSTWPDTQIPSLKCGTHPAAEKEPNAWGLYDMLGNVWEFCWDWYDAFKYGPQLALNPAGAITGLGRVSRGGSWDVPADFERCARRRGDVPGFRHQAHGFRAARTILQ